MDLGLKGKNVLVTGGSKGIGLACAQAFRSEGARVAEGLVAEAKRAGISETEVLKRMVAKLPMGRMAEPEEIADVVVFAASDRGRFLTGANITMDGASAPTVV